jgi:dTDP-4-dehydrorhamnose reductase
MPSNRTLVTGASGHLARFIARTFADGDVVALPRGAFDITDPAEVRRVVAETSPTLIVNCAAFNDVDGAEARPVDAFAVNAFAVRSLARAAEACGATLVHYSTDFVFDGTATEPYDDDATPAPMSTYGSSKLLGEWFALDAPRAYVLRVESLFGATPGWDVRAGTVDKMIHGLRTGQVLKVLTDRVVSPSYTPDIARATRHLLDTNAAPGVYHCVNAGSATWEAFALEAAAQLGVEPKLERLTMDQLTLKAARPRYCAMGIRKLTATGFVMPTWQDALRHWLAAAAAA